MPRAVVDRFAFRAARLPSPAAGSTWRCTGPTARAARLPVPCSAFQPARDIPLHMLAHLGHAILPHSPSFLPTLCHHHPTLPHHTVAAYHLPSALLPVPIALPGALRTTRTATAALHTPYAHFAFSPPHRV